MRLDLAHSRSDIILALPKEDPPLELTGSSRGSLRISVSNDERDRICAAGGSGEKADWAKSLKGFGDASVSQITSDFEGTPTERSTLSN